MGLENLSTIFDDITENSLDTVSIDSSPIVNKVTKGIPATTTLESLIGGGPSGISEELSSENIKKRTFDVTSLGKEEGGNLGKGKLIFDTLYKHSHSANTSRIQIDTGRVDPNSPAGNLKIITNRAGMGDLGGLNIKGNSAAAAWRATGFGFLGKEPYIVHDIPKEKNDTDTFWNGVGYNRDILPFKASRDDITRLGKFYASPAGVAFMAKENIISFKIGDKQIMAPPFPMPVYGNTGFINFLQQSFQGVGLGGSLRKPLTFSYSQKAEVGLPFNNLGDRPVGVKEISGIKIDDNLPKFLKVKAENTKQLILNKIIEKVQLPYVGRPTPFIDLSGGPKKTKYIDKISKQIPSTKKADKEIAEEGKGDFYVKIKDLRSKKFIYFRGFVTGITENVTPSFSPTNYIGRSEPVYVYERAERDLSFNLRVYPYNYTEFYAMYDKINSLTSLAYPEYIKQGRDVSRMKAPFTELYMAHIGSGAQGQFGFIKSLTYTVNESGDWDQQTIMPRLFDIAISYQILSKKPPQFGDTFYKEPPQPIRAE